MVTSDLDCLRNLLVYHVWLASHLLFLLQEHPSFIPLPLSKEEYSICFELSLSLSSEKMRHSNNIEYIAEDRFRNSKSRLVLIK